MGVSRPPLLGEDQARLLEEVSRAFGRTRGVENAIREGTRLAVPAFADLIVTITRGPELKDQLHVVHADPAREPVISSLILPLLPEILRVARADLQKGRQFRWLAAVNDSTTRFLAHHPSLVRLLHDLQVRSLVVVPLRTGGRILGGIAFCRMRDEPFQSAHLAAAQIMGRRASTAIETAQLYESSADERSRRARLESALEKWIRVFDLAAWGAAIVDGADQRIEAVNPAFARLHGYADAPVLVGRLYTDLVVPEKVNETKAWLAGPSQLSSPYESLHVRADGTVFPVLTDVTPLETGSRARSFVVTVQDLTELKRAEDRLRRAQRLEAVGRLAGGVAHEVNNMMTIILGFSDLLARSADLPPERHREIEEIRKAAMRAGRTTQQLLAFSRQQILQPTDLEINDVINELSPALRLLLPANILLDTSLAPMPATVHADRAQLDQVLINLAFNARDAMPGGGTLRLATDSRWLDGDTGRRLIGIPIPEGQYATISVIDTGHGMDASTVTQVFEPFFTTKPVGSGTGLGLATVYGIVKQSGGYVWVESTPGVGTTVTVCLPQVENTDSRRQSDRHQEVHPAECRSGTVLVVEDEDGVRDLARRVLEQQGHRVLEARDGPAALEMLDLFGEDLDLVLSDVIVPEIGTREMEQSVRKQRPGLPILYMSGYSREEMVERGLVPPGRTFLQKPFTGEELARLVCRVLDATAPVVGR